MLELYYIDYKNPCCCNYQCKNDYHSAAITYIDVAKTNITIENIIVANIIFANIVIEIIAIATISGENVEIIELSIYFIIVVKFIVGVIGIR